jgi:hypothetical protein
MLDLYHESNFDVEDQMNWLSCAEIFVQEDIVFRYHISDLMDHMNIYRKFNFTCGAKQLPTK